VKSRKEAEEKKKNHREQEKGEETVKLKTSPPAPIRREAAKKFAVPFAIGAIAAVLLVLVVTLVTVITHALRPDNPKPAPTMIATATTKPLPASSTTATPLPTHQTTATPAPASPAATPGATAAPSPKPSTAPSPTPTATASAAPGATVTPSMTASPSPAPSASRAPVEDTPDPAQLEKLLETGKRQLQNKEYKWAEESFKEAVSLSPACAEAYWNLGESYELQKKGKKALSCYQKSLKMQAGTAAHYRRVAAMLISSKDYKKAVESLKRAQKSDETAEGYFSIGRCYFMANDYDQSIIFLRCALKKDRAHYPSALMLAQIYRKKGTYTDAIGAYKIAHDIKPGQVSLLYQMGATAFEAGDYGLAKEYLKRYLLMENDMASRQEGEKMLKRAKVLAMKNIPPAVEKQTDFLTNVRVLGILKFGRNYRAFLEIGGLKEEITEGETILSDYYVLSIREERIILTRDETYVVLRPQ